LETRLSRWQNSRDEEAICREDLEVVRLVIVSEGVLILKLGLRTRVEYLI
jgi:hypothetical protein